MGNGIAADQGRVPEAWLNLAVQLPYPLPTPQTPEGRVATHGDLASLYSSECARIELLDGEYGASEFIPIPAAVMDEYRKYRPTPLRRACGLEKRLGFRGEIYFKREDGNPSGSHKPNTAIPQAYYAREQGLTRLVTDTGAGQWGSALAWACQAVGLDCTVFMTRNSYRDKPYRRYMMELSGGEVIASPSDRTAEGRKLLADDPDHRGSLGIGMGEAVEYARTHPGTRLALGCMSYYAALHQTVIGQELSEQLTGLGVQPDMLIGCVGGGTNFVGFVAPFVTARIAGRGPRLVAVESANIPVLTKGEYRYDSADAFGYAPRVKMYTLDRSFVPPNLHAGGLRYHGKSPVLSLMVHHEAVEAVAVDQATAFAAGRLFFEAEGVLPAPESAHAIAHVVAEVEAARDRGDRPVIVFCLSGHGYLDLKSYAVEAGLPN